MYNVLKYQYILFVVGSYIDQVYIANTQISEFAITVDPDEMAHNEPSHLDLQCLPSISSICVQCPKVPIFVVGSHIDQVYLV